MQQQRVRVKICGLTRDDDVLQAVQAGADAIGMVFYPASKRAVDLAQAARLRRLVPGFVSTVALFVNPTPDEVAQVIAQVGPDLLQFHGDETPQDCTRFGRRYLKAFRVGAHGMQTPEQIAAACAAYDDAAGWLFDSHSAGYGGSGVRFDTGLLSQVVRLPQARPIMLAGGLTPDNVADGIAGLQPYAVDVSSGVEVSPGEKSPDKILRFMRAVSATAASSAA